MAGSLQAQLESGAQQLGLELSPAQVTGLLDYLGLLTKWGKVYNLTAIRDPQEALTQHLLDCLTIIGPLRRQCPMGGRLLDVGSGAGLPGLVIAALCPEWQVTCVDTVGKKIAFIQQAAAQMRLPQLVATHGRVEGLAGPYDVISARAFASLPDLVSWSSQALAPSGVWMAMKGRDPVDERKALPSDIEVFHVELLQVPGLGAERCLVWMRRKR